MFLLRRIRMISCLILVLISTGCSSSPTSPQPIEQGWQISTPEEQGVDSSRLDQMMAIIQELALPVDSVLVVRHGQLVFEAYPNPEYGPDDMHLLYSVTKSFTSALIGIAIEERYIEGVDQRVVDIFPEWDINNLDSQKQELTIEDLLTMSCGFEWEGPDDNLHTWGDAIRSGNPVRYTLDQPMASAPGTEWVYNGGCSHILSAILTKTTGQSTLEFAREFLFEPLGITEIRWPTDPQGIYYGGQDIWLTPRDMARFGQLFLNNGVWEGQQIIPADWVSRSAETRFTHSTGGYGYQWWTLPLSDIYYASGALEQRIYVIPDLDMVVVFTSDNRASGLEEGELRSGTPMTEWLLGRFILPSCDDYAPAVYTNYGFSLEVPLGINGQELGKSFQGTASETAGLVWFQHGNSPYTTVGLQWDAIDGPTDLQISLEAFVETLRGLGADVDASAQPVATTEGDLELIYQPIEAEVGGAVFPGFVGSWYCEEAHRVYTLYAANIRELAEQIDTFAEFQQYIDSFTYPQ